MESGLSTHRTMVLGERIGGDSMIKVGDLVRTTYPNSRTGIVLKVEIDLVKTTFGWATKEYLEVIA